MLDIKTKMELYTLLKIVDPSKKMLRFVKTYSKIKGTSLPNARNAHKIYRKTLRLPFPTLYLCIYEAQKYRYINQTIPVLPPKFKLSQKKKKL